MSSVRSAWSMLWAHTVFSEDGSSCFAWDNEFLSVYAPWCCNTSLLQTKKDTRRSFSPSKDEFTAKGLRGKFPADCLLWNLCTTTCRSSASLALHPCFAARECVFAQPHISLWSHLCCWIPAWKPFVQTSKPFCRRWLSFSFDASFMQPIRTHLWRRDLYNPWLERFHFR